MTRDQLRREKFEDHLRRVLQAEARSSPMPAELLQIPDRWIGQPRKVTPALLGRWVAIVTVVVVAVASVSFLPRVVEFGGSIFRGPLTAREAATFVGVPPEQVVATRDGVVVLRLVPGPRPQAQLLLVSDTDAGLESSLLTQVPVPTGVFEEGSSLIWTEQLSCEPARGLAQPNILFGASDPSPTRMTINVPAQGTWHDRLFLFVLEEATVRPDQWVRLVTGSGEDRRRGLLFDRSDPCTGDAPRGH